MPTAHESTTGATPPASRKRWGAIIGLGIFIAFAALITLAVAIDWLQGVSTYFWQESTCTIESSSVVDRSDGEFELVVGYRYHIRGESFSGDRYRHGYTGSSEVAEARRLAARYAAGQTVPCWIDADEPWKAYLRRANLWRGLWIFLPLLFVAIGAGALYMIRGARGDAGRVAGATVIGASGAGRRKPVKALVGMLILFGAFFLFGFGFLVPFFVWPALQVVEARSWVAVPCEILSSEVRSHTGDDSTTYSIEALYRYRYEGQEYVSNRYQFMGGSSSGYEGKRQRVAEIPAGTRTECYVDPDDPYEAVIDRGFGVDYLFGLIPLVFGLIGAGGLWFALQTARGAKRDAALPSWTPTPAARLTGVSGGPIVLEPTFGPFGKLGCALFLALFWNGIVSVFLWQLVAEWRSGRPDWILALFLTPFVLIGLLLATGVPYSLLALVNPRPRVQLGPGALRANESAQLDWSFRGAASRVKALKIWLECSRRRTTSTDSEVRSESRKVREIEILDRGPGLPLAFGSVGVRLPPDVEPTSEGPNGVTWKLKLQGRIDYWPDVNEEFEVRVVNDSVEHVGE